MIGVSGKSPASKRKNLHIIPKRETQCKEELEESLKKQHCRNVREPPRWRHQRQFRCVPRGVHPVAPREPLCARDYQGCLVPPHARHKRNAVQTRRRIHNLLGRSGSAFLKRGWRVVLRSGDRSRSDRLAPMFPHFASTGRARWFNIL